MDKQRWGIDGQTRRTFSENVYTGGERIPKGSKHKAIHLLGDGALNPESHAMA